MDEKSYLPGRAVENGVELFSSSNELDLIRAWLPSAPDQVRIVHVSHERHEHTDSDRFIISCTFEDSTPVNTIEEANRLLCRWSTHIAPFDLPDKTWVGGREISLSWYPEGLKLRYGDEVPTHERVKFALQFEAEQALDIWKVLRARHADESLPDFSPPHECKEILFKLGPGGSADGLQFTQEELEDSILDSSDTWLYLLAHLRNQGLDAPLLDDFQTSFDRLKDHPNLTDLSPLAAKWTPGKSDAPELSPDDQARASDLLQMTIREMDALLSPRLAEVNQLLMLVTEPADHDDEPEDHDSDDEGHY